jgi:hypothetical protein
VEYKLRNFVADSQKSEVKRFHNKPSCQAGEQRDSGLTTHHLYFIKYNKSNKVYLLRKHIKTTRPSTKLDFKKLEPFKILKKVSSVNYRLHLPKNSRLHPVFHISLLEPAPGNTSIASNEELQPEIDPNVYWVERILDRKLVGRTEHFLVKWKGYRDTDNTWEPERNINHELVAAFCRQHPRQCPQGTGPSLKGTSLECPRLTQKQRQ